MKKYKLLSLGALIITATLLVSCGPTYRTIQATDQSASRLAAKRNVIVLDVRTPEEYAEGHLPRAVNINLQDPGFLSRLDSLDKKEKYLVYCKSGRRSEQATNMMKQKGFRNVTDMQGGITAWKGEVIK